MPISPSIRAEEAPIHGLLGSSITYRIATGPREGQKVFTLQTLPAEPDAPRPEVAESSGFSLHAGIAAKASQRDKIERLARYVSRPPVATERLSLTRGGNVRYALKTPYRDGTTHVIFEPEDFIARPRRAGAKTPCPPDEVPRRVRAGEPRPGTDRAQDTRRRCQQQRGEVSVSDRQRAMSWAQRLKRVFAIDIETCRQCGGRLRVIASIEATRVIERILEHLGRTAEPSIRRIRAAPRPAWFG